jgi:hypothetical protein
MSKVKITNPRPGSAQYTTADQADRHVRRGEAVLIGKELTFLSDAERRHMRNIESQLSVSARSNSDVYVDIKQTIWWNGGDVDGMHRPGERVS